MICTLARRQRKRGYWSDRLLSSRVACCQTNELAFAGQRVPGHPTPAHGLTNCRFWGRPKPRRVGTFRFRSFGAVSAPHIQSVTDQCRPANNFLTLGPKWERSVVVRRTAYKSSKLIASLHLYIHLCSIHPCSKP